MTLPAQWVAAQLTLSTPRTTLGTVIKQIQSQSKYQFFYDDKLSATPVEALNVKDASLEEVLNTVLKNKNIAFKVEDSIVYFSEKGATADANQQKTTQEHKLTGQVIDATGEPLIGVNVSVKGTTIGCITDLDGKYTLTVPSPKSDIVFSYIGYKQQTLAAGNEPALNVTLTEDTQMIGEVVVTALGIKREKKMLGYAVQEVKSDQLNKTGDPSVTSALQGKVAGLQMNTAGTGLGGSTKITIRGNSSLADNNQPLWIVDGVPFSDNNNSDASFYGGVDRGGSSVDINPEDIESISVLKGPNAAALYGSRAGNGVILVTTKKGTKNSGFGVRYSGNFTWSQVAETLDMQDRYGQGHITNLDNDGNPVANYFAKYDATDSSSWGPALDGSQQKAWNGETYGYSKYGNKIEDYFNTGFAQNHNVAVSSVTDTSHFRASFGSSNSTGTFPNEKLDRINMDLNAGAELNKYFSMDGKVSLSRTKADDRPYFGTYGAVAQLMAIPNNIRLDDLKQYTSADKAHVNWTGPTASIRNPYYVLNQRHNSDERWRAFGYYGMKVNFTDWLHFSAKYAFDYYRTRIQDTNAGDGIHGESAMKNITDDEMNREEQNFFEQNAEFVFLGDKQLTDNFRLGFTLGANLMYQKYESLNAGVINMLDKGSWMFNAANMLNTAGESGRERATNSVFGSLQLSWKEYLALDLTARNDWSSTLPTQNNSFFYPSANVSFVISDFVRSLDKSLPSWITFAKVRLSAAQVGKDTDPYQLYNTYAFEFEKGVLIPSKSNVKMNDQLKPEISSSYEAGLDMKFFNNRLGFDFTYYNSRTKNQIMKVPAAAPWSGGKWVNAGLITNQGFEMMIYATPVQTKDFTFDLNVNLSKNVSNVEELADGVDHIYFNGDSNFPINVGARPGHKLGEIYSKTLYQRDANGNILINKENGLPLTSTDANERLANPIGNIQPNLLMSVSPSFTYKGITLSAMFDMKFGGDIISISEMTAAGNGMARRTQERGENNNYQMVFPGVYADGTPNTTPIKASDYYGAQIAEDFIYDASFIKLKELSIGYALPKSLLKKTPIQSLNLAFVARNLAYLMKHTPGTSPEGGYDTTMFSQAIDFMAVPYTRTFGFSINLGF